MKQRKTYTLIALLLPHVLVSQALKSRTFKVMREHQELVSVATRYQNANNFILNTANCKSLWRTALSITLIDTHLSTFLCLRTRDCSCLGVDGTLHPVKVNVHQKNTFHLWPCPVWVKAKPMQHGEIVACTICRIFP